MGLRTLRGCLRELVRIAEAELTGIGIDRLDGYFPFTRRIWRCGFFPDGRVAIR